MTVAALAALAARDPELVLFGAETHYHHRLPPASLDEVRAIEERLGCALPDEYRAHLLDVSAGGMGPGYGLFWLPALLEEPGLADDAWYDAVARRAFASSADQRWAAERFAPLTDAAIEARLEALRLPAAIHARMREEAAWTRTFEGRRNVYLEALTGPIRDLARAPRAAARPFPFAAGEEVLAARDGIDGAVPLCDFGCARLGVVVVTGPRRGEVWTVDLDSATASGAEQESDATARPRTFATWLASWIADGERALAAGARPNGRRLWA